MRGRDPGRPAGCALPASLDGVSEPCHRRVGGRGGRWAARRPCRARRPPRRRRGPHTGRDVRDEGRAVRVRLRAGRAPGVLRDLADRVPRAGRQLRDGVTGLELSLRRTVVWYGGLGLLTGRVMRSLALPPKYFRLILREIESMGVQSLGVALTAAIFTGMVFTIQSAVNMARFGAETYVGPVAALAILRELGPVLTAILVGGKVASGITAELGSMKVTEQIDALRTLGVNYVKRLVVPRVLASLVVFPLLTVLTDAVGVLGGMVIMFVERGADMYAYWNTMTYWVVPKDFLTGIGKSVFFGAVVTLIGCYNGLSTEGGTEGLGRATTATVVHVTMGVIVSDFFLTKLFLTLFY
ncbi:MAG: transporter [Candidatus Rokuibacteriota bacterium]|nr:MAG: transporter [Candidatus Rokubacteria bacterium]